MGCRRVFCFLLASVVVAASSAGAAEGPVVIRRFALIAGANDGGPDRMRLRYANSDADAISKVLSDLGGVSSADILQLKDPDLATFLTALENLRGLLEGAASPTRKLEAIVYYSGHSDEQGLLLSGERLPYGALRRSLKSLPADVRIAILDSCASGAMVRSKGGVRRAPFMVDASSDVKGHAFLTSSSADEVAQESDRIGGSFFTHFLVAGLRGAADETGDGRVTLSEAYQYAFTRTLTRTQKTQSGAQHANYDIQLAGSGEVVLTDLNDISGSMVLKDDLGGRVYVSNADERLVAEVHKESGRTMELALEPGTYYVLHDDGLEISAGEFVVDGHTEVLVSQLMLAPVEVEPTVSRGPAPREAAPGTYEFGGTTYHRRPFNASFVPTMSLNARQPGKVLNHIAVGFISDAAAIRGIQVSAVANGVDDRFDGIQVAGIVNRTDGPQRGLQVAGVANNSEGPFLGIEVAGVANILRGDMQGLQAAAVFNKNEGKLRWGQIAGVGNFNIGDTRAFTLAGVLNIAKGKMEGVQAAGVFNHAAQDVLGLQAAGVLNIAGSHVHGAQIAVVNIAGSFQGAQLGIINIAGEAKGVQIGLVNVSEDIDGAPLGLVNIVRKGRRTVSVWADELSPVNAAYKFGSKYLHTMLVVGGMPAESKKRSHFLYGLALGSHLPLGESFFAELEAGAYSLGGDLRLDPGQVQLNNERLLGRVRLTLGVKLASWMSIFGGVSGNVLDAGPTPVSSWATNKRLGRRFKKRWQAWPGAFVGIEI